MFGSQILDIAIAMILFYLFISLICTAVREGIETLTKSRAMNIERGIRELLSDPDGTTITKSLFDHPQLAGLFAGAYEPAALKKGFSGFGPKLLPNDNMGRWARSNLPSYIPASNFAIALLDITARGAVSNPAPPIPPGQLLFDAIRSSVATLPNIQVQRAVLSALDRTNGDLAQAQKNLEDWFNSAMDRVSGWYKRRTQLILFVLGLAAAVAFNLDSFAALNVVSTNKSIRDGLVAAADVQIKNTRGCCNNGIDKSNNVADKNNNASDKGNADKGNNSVDKNTNSVESMKTLAEDFQQLNLPMGWSAGRPMPQFLAACPKDTADKMCDLNSWDVIRVLLGWLITAAAVTLGAPFWFDTLSKFMSVRSSLKPEKASQTKN